MVRLQDDFYDAVNGEWEKTAVIPEDKPRTGGFSDLADEIEELMLETTDKWLAGEDVPTDPILQHFVTLHRQMADFEKRDREGVAPVLPIIAEYKALDSFAAFTEKLVEFELAGKPNLMPFGVSPDFMNAQLNVLWASAIGTILPDTTYYEKGHEKGAELLATWRSCQEALLPHFGFSDEEVADLLDKRLAFDAMIAERVLSNEESSRYAELYHPYAWADFTALVPELPLDAFFTAILGQTPEQVIVSEERFWKAASQI